MNKYKNVKFLGFDSKKEYYRYNELKLLEKSGEISGLQTQVTYELIPSQWETVNGKKRCVEHAVKYIADFQYVDKNGDLVVEDTKSSITKTPGYVIKRKLMLHVHGIKIKEI